MVWPTLGSRTAKEQEQDGYLPQTKAWPMYGCSLSCHIDHIKVVVVSQLPIALRAERRSDGFYAVSCHVFGVWPLECSSVVSLPSGRALASLAGRSILV